MKAPERDSRGRSTGRGRLSLPSAAAAAVAAAQAPPAALPAPRPAATSFDVYSSLPLQGGSSARTIPLVNGIKLALSEAKTRPASSPLNYKKSGRLHRGGGQVDAGQTSANAKEAATDPKAVYYIGEFNSGASEVSIPILTRAGSPR